MMPPLAELLVGLTSRIPIECRSPDAGVLVRVDQLDVSLPLEARIGAGAAVYGSAPRGRLATGFDPPLGRLTVRFEVGEP
jgi:hypothetical protein